MGVLASILDLRVLPTSKMVINGFIGLAMMENIYLDTKIMPVSVLVLDILLIFDISIFHKNT
jgi:hypothetical protein